MATSPNLRYDWVRPESAPGQLCNPHSPHSLPRTPQCHHFEDAYFWGATFQLGTAGLCPQTRAQGGVAPLLRNGEPPLPHSAGQGRGTPPSPRGGFPAGRGVHPWLQPLSKSRKTHQPLDDHCSLIVNIQGSCYNWRIGLPLNAWGEAFPVGVQCLVRSSPSSYFIIIFDTVLIKSSFISHGTRHSRTSTIQYCWGSCGAK